MPCSFQVVFRGSRTIMDFKMLLMFMLLTPKRGATTSINRQRLVASPGDQVTLFCRIPSEYNLTAVTWYKFEETEKINIGFGDSFLTNTIKDVVRLHFMNLGRHGQKQKYACKSLHTLNQTTLVRVFEVVTITDFTKPIILYDGKMVAGEEMEFSCMTVAIDGEFGSERDLYFTWMSSVYIGKFNTERNHTYIKSSVTVNLTSGDHQKPVSCKLWDPVFSASPLSSTILLDVLYPPELKIKPKTIQTYTGGQVHMFCETNANPAPKAYTWFRAGVLVSRREYISIDNADHLDAGEYTCIAENSVGTGTSNATVIVLPVTDISLELNLTLVNTSKADVPVNSSKKKISSDSNQPFSLQNMLQSWEFWIVCLGLIIVVIIAAAVTEVCWRQTVGMKEDTESVGS